MNDLQIALIGLGAAAVAGVWAYNKWQERRHHKLAEKVFAGRQPDVLLGREAEDPPTDERREPVLEPIMDSEAAIPPGAAPAPASVSAAAAVSTPTEPALPAEWADDIADCAIRIDFAEPVPAPALWALQTPWAAHLAKTLSWLGLDGRQWRRLTAHDAGGYTVVCAVLQLADRQGAVSDNELSVFLDGVRQVAQQFAGVAEMPPRDQVLLHARALDEFCAGLDVQLGVNVIDAGGGAFSGTKLRGLAEASGLVLADDGLFRAVDDQGLELFTLGNLGAEVFEAEAMKSLATRGITLSLDVPRVADGTAVFNRLVTAARQLAQGLGGQVVDGQGHPLAETMIAGIRAKIGELQQRMAAHQIPAGSARARRLFS